MKYYLDTEFDGFGGELISLALVCDDFDELYLVNNRATYSNVMQKWVAENVLPIIDYGDTKRVLCYCSLQDFPRMISKFISSDEDPIIISDWPDDIKYFCQSIITGPGMMVNIPKLSFEVIRCDPYEGDEKNPGRHNALIDARKLRDFCE